MLCRVIILVMNSNIYHTKIPALKPWELTGALNHFGVHSTKTENAQRLLPQDRKLLLALASAGSHHLHHQPGARCFPSQERIIIITITPLRSPPPKLKTSSDCSHPKGARTESCSWLFLPGIPLPSWELAGSIRAHCCAPALPTHSWICSFSWFLQSLLENFKGGRALHRLNSHLAQTASDTISSSVTLPGACPSLEQRDAPCGSIIATVLLWVLFFLFILNNQNRLKRNRDQLYSSSGIGSGMN